MAKEAKETEGVEEKLFEGFNFLDAPVPKTTVKDTKTTKTNTKKEANTEVVSKTSPSSDELSEEDELALEATIKASEKANKAKKEVIIKEELEEDDNDTSLSADANTEPEETEFSAFAKFLADKGTIDLEETDKVESEDDLDKIIGKTVKNGINSYKQSIPEDGQKFLEFIENGGNPAEFHKLYYADGSFEDFTIEDEESQKHVIKEALKLEEFTDQEIEDELNDIIDLGKLEKKATTYLNKLKKVEKEQKKLLLEAQASYAAQQEALRVQEWKDFKDGLMNKETLGGFKLTQKQKDDLWDYMANPVNKKTGETQYQRDSKENLDARYMFAYLLKNKWDIKSLEKQVETKQVSKLRDKLSNYTDTRSKLKSAKTNVEAEDTSNPFANFKKAF